MGCIVSPWIPLLKQILRKQFHDDVVPGLLFVEFFCSEPSSAELKRMSESNRLFDMSCKIFSDICDCCESTLRVTSISENEKDIPIPLCNVRH